MLFEFIAQCNAIDATNRISNYMETIYMQLVNSSIESGGFGSLSLFPLSISKCNRKANKARSLAMKVIVALVFKKRKMNDTKTANIPINIG